MMICLGQIGFMICGGNDGLAGVSIEVDLTLECAIEWQSIGWAHVKKNAQVWARG